MNDGSEQSGESAGVNEGARDTPDDRVGSGGDLLPDREMDSPWGAPAGIVLKC